MGRFTVHDTRRCAAKPHEEDLMNRPFAAGETYRAPTPRGQLQHHAMSTGAPGWAPPPAIPLGKADCRMLEIALSQDSSFTRESTWANSWTSRTGVHPFRPSLSDRLHSLMALLGTAYALSRKAFHRHQAEHKRRAASLNIDVVPDDVMVFEFNMAWSELRHELHVMISDHISALQTLRDAVPGSPVYHNATAVAQRTSPESLVLALSGMSIFDPLKWNADACPYDEEEAARVIQSMSNRLAQTQGPKAVDDSSYAAAFSSAQSPVPTIALSPSSAQSSNSSFVPMTATYSVTPSRPASPEAQQHLTTDNSSFPKIPSLQDLPEEEDHAEAATAVEDLESTAMKASGRVSPPPRPSSIASCMNPLDIQERQAQSVAYRQRVLQLALTRGSGCPV